MDHLLLHSLPGHGARDSHLLLFPSKQGPQHHLLHPLSPKQNALHREQKPPLSGEGASCKEQQLHILEDQACFGRQVAQPVIGLEPGDSEKQHQEEENSLHKVLQVKTEEQESLSLLTGSSSKKKRGELKAAANHGGGKEDGSSNLKAGGEIQLGKVEEPEEIKKEGDRKENCDAKALVSGIEGAIKTELVEPPEEDCKGREEAASKPHPSSNGPAHVSKDVSLPQPLGAQQPQELKIPVTLHPVPPGTRIQFQGPPPSELIRVTKVPVAQVPLKMQSLLEPSVKIETKDVPLTVLPSDAGLLLHNRTSRNTSEILDKNHSVWLQQGNIVILLESVTLAISKFYSGPSIILCNGHVRFLIVVYLLAGKSETSEMLECSVAMMTNKFGRAPEVIQMNHGSEYMSRSSQAFLTEKGINHRTSDIYTPEQSGSAEKQNRSLVDKMLCLLIDLGLPNKWCREAYNDIKLPPQ
ncbi:Transcription factor SOX-30 [Varanus komodoensis]|nr:Transcription factor SOX-30 [Varanus komodoensis]